MGVSGSGKSTIGKMLAKRLELPYREADDFHPQANIDKMAQGTALNDNDRKPWLEALAKEASILSQKSGGIISCSALKQSYRDLLNHGLENKVKWVYLQGDYSLLWNRMSKREDHFMPAGLLQSQFDTLEEPVDAITVSVSLSPEEIINTILESMNSAADCN